MSADKLKQIVLDVFSHVTFEYKGISCGIDPFSETEFDIWYGDEVETVNSIDRVMDTPIFDGKPLNEIIDKITELDY
ncbi:MAG: hypothetical protein ACLRZ9_13035 [Eubacterium sp.]